jgi:hypothetical protein
MSNPNAPHFVLAAAKRIYAELPMLVTDSEWANIQPQVDTCLAALETQPDNFLASTQLVGLLAQYEPARLRLAQEMKVQEVISANISHEMAKIAGQLGLNPNAIDGLAAAAYARLTWEVDPETVPAPDEEVRTRGITLSDGGVGGAKSVKFRNMQVELWDFTKVAAGFVTTVFDTVAMPHPLLIAASVILTAAALHDALKVELSEQEASVFWGMIRAELNGKRGGLSEEIVLATTNDERKRYGLQPLSSLQVRHSLRKLEQIASIEMSDGVYRIVERYTIKD